MMPSSEMWRLVILRQITDLNCMLGYISFDCAQVHYCRDLFQIVPPAVAEFEGNFATAICHDILLY